MRLLLELAVLAALIALGWNKSFSERVGLSSPPQQHARKAGANAPRAIAPVSAPKAQPAAAQVTNVPAAPAVSATPNNAWMWDPNRKGSLDRKGTPRPSPQP